jgi:hypothetical protein
MIDVPCNALRPAALGNTAVTCSRPKGHDGWHEHAASRWTDDVAATGVHPLGATSAAVERCGFERPADDGLEESSLRCRKGAGHTGYHQDASGRRWGSARAAGTSAIDGGDLLDMGFPPEVDPNPDCAWTCIACGTKHVSTHEGFYLGSFIACVGCEKTVLSRMLSRDARAVFHGGIRRVDLPLAVVVELQMLGDLVSRGYVNADNVKAELEAENQAKGLIDDGREVDPAHEDLPRTYDMGYADATAQRDKDIDLIREALKELGIVGNSRDPALIAAAIAGLASIKPPDYNQGFKDGLESAEVSRAQMVAHYESVKAAADATAEATEHKLDKIEARLAAAEAANGELMKAVLEPAPVEMRLRCPQCHALHIDEGAFKTKPHHTHACQACGEVWRPAVVNTVGVQFLPGFKNEGSAS